MTSEKHEEKDAEIVKKLTMIRKSLAAAKKKKKKKSKS